MARLRHASVVTHNRMEPEAPASGHPEGAAVWGDPPILQEGHVPLAGSPDIDEEPDDAFDGDSDAEDFDEDGTPLEDDPDTAEDGARNPSAPAPAGIAALDDSRIYRLSVFFRDNGSMGCEYDAAPWHETCSGNPTVDFNVGNRSDFLRACTSWLETRKNAFLQTRRIHAYLADETPEDYRADPLVTAKGFLLRVNSLLPEEGRVAEFNLSRILPHIWLIWEDGISMPLQALFSDETKIQWIAEGCKQKFPVSATWQRMLAERIRISPKEKSAAVTAEAFETQGPLERCRYLFRRAGLRSDTYLKQVLDLLIQG